MSEPLMTITVDKTALLDALAKVGPSVHVRLKAAAHVTAKAIAAEAGRRFARRAAGPTRGGAHTAEGMTVEETHTGDGYVVFVKSPEMPNLPQWLEFGTKFMTPHPAGGALFPAARLEEGAHLRRVQNAVQDGLDDTGLGS